MKLLKFILKNFKGLRHFELDTQGGNVNIFGDNAKGKTTIEDAYQWLLFGKDSQGRADFRIKTLDEYNNPIHGLEHEVEGLFEVNGAKLTLRRVYMEDWTKKRGSVKPVLTGHTTNYFINGVPEKKRAYEDKVAEIANSNLFKLLSNPDYFNQLHWEKRRQMLLGVCGDISDEDVIASNKALDQLSGILGDRKLDDHLKVIKAKRTDINEEIEKIPVRIDEVNRGLSDIEGLDATDIQNKLDLNSHFAGERQQEIVRIENGGEVAEKTKKLRELQGEMMHLNNELCSKISLELDEKRGLNGQIGSRIQSLKSDIENHKRNISRNKTHIENRSAINKKLLERWHEVNKSQFTFEQDDTCPTCGQALPEEKLIEAREKALAKFNLEKAGELEKISLEGKTRKAEIEELQSENASFIKKIEEIELQITIEEKTSVDLEAEIDNLIKQGREVTNDPAITKKSQEIAKLEEVIAKLKTSTTERVSEIRNELAELKQKAKELKESKDKIDDYEKGQKRIKELHEEHKKLAREYEKLEQELYLCEEFIKSKVALLEGKINTRFKYARFKMFDVQVNGAVVPCCETLINGVPYSDLNTAARVNVGIDIINTLSEHYGFEAPIFIDNAESVTEIAEAKGQMICLVVSKPDKQLRTEVI